MRGIRIRPDNEGLKVSLFDLEADIMEVAWSYGTTPFAVAAIHKALEGTRPIAYTTVMTTISRLHEKGLLEREKDGRRYLYVPTMSRDEFLKSLTREVMDSLPPMGKEAAMALLVERVAEGNEQDLERLELLIRARRGL